MPSGIEGPRRRVPEAAIRDLGYDAIWQGQPRWNGVAILSRVGDIHETRRGLPGDPDDDQSRYTEAAVNGVLIAGLYLPNGNPRPGPKFDYKLRWFERLHDHLASLFSLDAPVVVAGDFNVMPTDLDVYAPERWRDNALFAPEVRQAYARLFAKAWTDALRHLHPTEQLHTFWKYWRQSFERDAGLRIDHILLNRPAAARRPCAGMGRIGRQGQAFSKDLIGSLGHPPLPAPGPAARLPSHPALWPSRQFNEQGRHGARAQVAWRGRADR